MVTHLIYSCDISKPMQHAPTSKRLVTLHTNLPLIETADKAQLDMLVIDKSVAPHVLIRLSDTVAVVAPGHFDQVLNRLRKLGHMPKVLEQ